MDSLDSVSRRGLLVAGGSALLLPSLALAQRKPGRKRVLRVAHLTDIHVQPERSAAEGMEAALTHVHALKDKPNLIFTGGDLIMDAMGATRERAQAQWDIFTKTIATSKIRVENTIGNHDVWGWNNRGKYSEEPGFGKAWTCDILGLAKPYRSFDLNGWHFIVLDSTFPVEGGGYTAKLDDEQFEWLKAELESTPKTTPILVISHIPIICASAMFDDGTEKTGNWVIPGAWMHIDARKIKDLFFQHKNVKVCLSGHIHLVDEVLYNGVKYLCNGAVSAGWWGGDYQECTYGYSLVDLFNDGNTETQYTPYGWKTK